MIEHAAPEVVARAAHYGVALDGPMGASLARYLERLLETNRAFNLTAVTDPAAAWEKHIVDSLSLAPALRADAELERVVDVGSGGGLPGIPLAIVLPERTFTLLEATGKKARFLTEVSRELGLTNVRVVEERAESYGRGAGRAQFDAVTSRAVSRLPVLLELTLPLLRPRGLCLALKGEQAELEVQEAARALRLLGGAVRDLERTPTGTIIRVDKCAPTPDKYPRRPGEPKKAPL
ncbi:MAG TPA: 16S rRNA (guanine(527)-N(7))-methyltransferase RsmG [Polyangiales bacterium]